MGFGGFGGLRGWVSEARNLHGSHASSRTLLCKVTPGIPTRGLSLQVILLVSFTDHTSEGCGFRVLGFGSRRIFGFRVQEDGEIFGETRKSQTACLNRSYGFSGKGQIRGKERVENIFDLITMNSHNEGDFGDLRSDIVVVLSRLHFYLTIHRNWIGDPRNRVPVEYSQRLE